MYPARSLQCLRKWLHTLPSERNSRLFLIYNDQCLTSLHHAETRYHLISFIPFPSAHSKVIIFPLQLIHPLTPSSTHPSSLACLLELQGLMKWKLFPTIIFFPFSSVIISAPFPSPFLPQASTINKASQACGKLLTLTNYDTLGGKHIIKPSVCLHKKYSVHNFKRVKVSPSLQNTYLI